MGRTPPDDSSRRHVYRLTLDELDAMGASFKASAEWAQKQLDIDPDLTHLYRAITPEDWPKHVAWAKKWCHVHPEQLDKHLMEPSPYRPYQPLAPDNLPPMHAIVPASGTVSPPESAQYLPMPMIGCQLGQASKPRLATSLRGASSLARFMRKLGRRFSSKP